jgi:hypothetical protein
VGTQLFELRFYNETASEIVYLLETISEAHHEEQLLSCAAG